MKSRRRNRNHDTDVLVALAVDDDVMAAYFLSTRMRDCAGVAIHDDAMILGIDNMFMSWAS